MYFVMSGEVEIRFRSSKPSKAIHKGGYFGELGLIIENHKRTGTAIAIKDCKLSVLGQNDVKSFLDTAPEKRFFLLQNICEYLVCSEQNLIDELELKNDELEKTLDYLKRTKEELDYQELLVNIDELTDLYNRRCFNTQLPKYIERAKAENTNLGLLIIDLNKFKEINDVHGHMAGDLVLQKVAKILHQSVREKDLPCRLGGDEFAIIISGVDNNKMRVFSERLKKQVGELLVVVTDCTITADISIGFTVYRQGEPQEDFIKRADDELYRDKDSL